MPTFDSNRVSQSEITADRNVAGRDLQDNSNTHYHYHQPPIIYREDKRLRTLVEEHEQEKKINPDYKQFSEKLNNFLNRKVEGNLRNLSQKLIDGDRTHFVDFAMEVKEFTTKKIMKNCHYVTAEKIYTHLLVEIRTVFLSEMSSRIKSGDFTNYNIDDRILERIIEPQLSHVEGCSLQIDKEELFGLLYILTGNCYIEWD